METHLFNYGKTGHFWVKEYEYLRQLEYRIAILRDKREYLGKEFCTEEEEKLSYLAEFPPLNFCCYPAVSEKYIVPSYPKWKVSEKALNEMMKLAQEAGDHSLIRWLKVYSYVPGRVIARKIACMLHRTKHTELVDLIDRKLAQAAAVYQDRQFVTEKNGATQLFHRWKRGWLTGRGNCRTDKDPKYTGKGGSKKTRTGVFRQKGGNAERRAFFVCKGFCRI